MGYLHYFLTTWLILQMLENFVSGFDTVKNFVATVESPEILTSEDGHIHCRIAVNGRIDLSHAKVGIFARRLAKFDEDPRYQYKLLTIGVAYETAPASLKQCIEGKRYIDLHLTYSRKMV